MNLFFDIETIPDQTPGAIDKHILEVRPPGQYKKPESIDRWMRDNADRIAVEAWKKSALHGIDGEVVSISWAFDDGEIEGVIRSKDEDEANVINQFFAAIRRSVHVSEGDHGRLEWIGHNIIEFDLRFLYQRCVILGIKPPVKLPVDARHGHGVFDTMKAWCGWKGYEKQDRIIEALDCGLEGGDVDGSMVWDMVQAGLLDQVLDYNKLDVEKTRAMYRRMTWQS